MLNKYKDLLLNQRNIYPFYVLLILVATSLLLPDTALTYLDKWGKFDESLGHGYLIFAVVIFELFRSSSNFTVSKVESKHYLIFVILLLAIFHEVSAFWGVLIFQQFSFYLIWLVAIAYILGVNYLKRIYFPLMFFLFAVPFWEFSNAFFLDLTTQAVTLLLSFSDLPIFIHENFIETPYGMIVVAEGCSGIRYFEIGFALSVYAVQGERLPLRFKLFVIFTGIALSIITNWIRVIGLVYIGYWTEMTSNLMKDHETYGFILFFIVISGVIIVINYLRSRYSLANTSNLEESPKVKIPFPTINVLTKSIAIGMAIILVNALFLKQLPINYHSKQPLIDDGQLFPILNKAGSFNEEQRNINYQGEKCKFIIRTYNFETPGSNVLPYDDILNAGVAITTAKYSKVINYENKAIKVNQVSLRAINNNSRSNLYYWYGYADFQTNNKYIAKLLEISYLFNSNDKMTLNLIWCPRAL